MALTSFLVHKAQPGYAQQIKTIAQNWDAMLGPSALEPLDEESFVAKVIEKLESGTLPEETQLQVVSDLLALSWWRGLPIADLQAGRLFACATKFFASLCDGMTVPPRKVSRQNSRRNHAVFVGTFQDPRHSPTSAAIDYIASLLLNTNVENIDVYYSGEIIPRLQDYIDENIKSRKVKFYKYEFDGEFIINIYTSSIGTFHFMCEPHLSPVISILSMFGPTVMFICGDEIPLQYLDVYWFTKDAPYIKERWQRRGAPVNIIENYVHIPTYPALVQTPKFPLSKKDLGFSGENFIISTVGNRLGIDLDESFVNGIEDILKRYPNAVWLVVGDLPDNLIYACKHVFGDQFQHLVFDPNLYELLTVADVFANPFRRGGGVSAHIALASKCVVCCLGSGDVSALIPKDCQSASKSEYFETLERLMTDQDFYADWLQAQQTYFEEITDAQAFSKSLFSAVDLAYSRYEKRRGLSLMEMIFGPKAELKQAV